MPIPLDETTYELKDACGMINYKDAKMYVTKAKMSPGQITFKELPPEQVPSFRKAKEIKSLLDSGAVRILSVEESLRFLKEKSRLCLGKSLCRPSEADGCFRCASQRLLRQELPATGTPRIVGKVAVVCHRMAWPDDSWDWKIRADSVDIINVSLSPNVFLLGDGPPCRETRRQRFFSPDRRQGAGNWRVACPRTRPSLDMMCDNWFSCLQKCTAWWMDQLGGDAAFCNYVSQNWSTESTSTTGVCSPWMDLKTLKVELCQLVASWSSKLTTSSRLVMKFIDRKMQWLENKLRFGKVEILQTNVEGSGYGGRRLKQNPDFSFEYHMTDYINNRLKPIQFERKFYKKDAASEKLNQEEEQQLRGIIVAINWVAREGRPDASASASILSGIFPNANVCRTPWRLTTSLSTSRRTRSSCAFIQFRRRTSAMLSFLTQVSLGRWNLNTDGCKGFLLQSWMLAKLPPSASSVGDQEDWAFQLPLVLLRNRWQCSKASKSQGSTLRLW